MESSTKLNVLVDKVHGAGYYIVRRFRTRTKRKGGGLVAYDYSVLNGRIVEKFGTQYKFAEAMELSERTMSAKLNGLSPWKSNEILKAVNLLEVDIEDIPKYFFKVKVQKNEQKV